jgi:predicted PurR-regulated permease PerM
MRRIAAGVCDPSGRCNLRGGGIRAGSVCLAAGAILWLTGHPYAALFLSAWGLIVVGLIDNVIKPFLAKSGMNMPGAVVFFALIGGIGAFGAVGLLLGPLIVALFLSLVTMYQRDFRSEPRAKTTRAA